MNAALTLSVSIEQPPVAVYGFIAEPGNLPKWSLFILSSELRDDGVWRIETQSGPAEVRFAARNNFGVVDHWVRLNPETEVYVPLRVVANGNGSEVLFTVFRQPEMTDAAYEADIELVRKDLLSLKAVLER
jgi:hypothetical protein